MRVRVTSTHVVKSRDVIGKDHASGHTELALQQGRSGARPAAGASDTAPGGGPGDPGPSQTPPRTDQGNVSPAPRGDARQPASRTQRTYEEQTGDASHRCHSPRVRPAMSPRWAGPWVPGVAKWVLRRDVYPHPRPPPTRPLPRLQEVRAMPNLATALPSLNVSRMQTMCFSHKKSHPL